MTAETTTLTRELDRRYSDGIEVRLLWRPHDNPCLVAVSDARTEDAFAIDVRPGSKPPSAYAGSPPTRAGGAGSGCANRLCARGGRPRSAPRCARAASPPRPRGPWAARS